MTANTIQFSGAIPASYDQHLGPVLFEPYARDLARRAAAVPCEDVLELACGTGRLTAHLAAIPGCLRLTATDVNPDMLAFAARRLGPGPQAIWHRVDGVDLPYLDESFDVVLCQFGVMFFSDKPQAMREAYRVLKPGGRLIFTVWDRLEHNAWSQLADRLLREYFPENPPAFFATPFGYFDADTIRGDVAGGGFQQVSLEEVSFPGRPGQGASVALGLLYGTPVCNELTGRDPDRFQAFYQRLLAEQTRLFDAGEAAVSLRAWVVTAGKNDR